MLTYILDMKNKFMLFNFIDVMYLEFIKTKQMFNESFQKF